MVCSAGDCRLGPIWQHAAGCSCTGREEDDAGDDGPTHWQLVRLADLEQALELRLERLFQIVRVEHVREIVRGATTFGLIRCAKPLRARCWVTRTQLTSRSIISATVRRLSASASPFLGLGRAHHARRLIMSGDDAGQEYAAADAPPRATRARRS